MGDRERERLIESERPIDGEIAAKGHVSNEKCTFGTTGDALAMMKHLIHVHLKRVFVPQDDHRHRVTH